MKRAIALALIAACGSGGASTQRTTFSNGRMHEQYAMRNGKRHGPAATWYANGSVESRGTYVQDKREGTFRFFTEDGEFEYQALYVQDEVVWRSTDPNATPDRRAIVSERTERIKKALVSKPPVAYFTSLDRMASLDRVAVQVGLGGPGERSLGDARRMEVFGMYREGAFGGYAQFSRSTLTTMSTTLDSHSMEAGGLFRRAVPVVGDVTSRAGLLVPLGDTDGSFLAGTAGSFQRPTDAAAASTSALVLRTSASTSRTARRLVVQADAGVDWLFGGSASAFDAIGRFNVGAGFGAPWALLSVELTNTMLLSEPGRRLHGVGIGGTFRYQKVSASGLFSRVFSGDTSLTLTVGYEL
jgi:hypothetical protein